MAARAGSHHVVMLVNNPCINDSRVIKSAEALVESGRRVTVLCRQAGKLPVREERGGVTYVRVEPVPLSWTQLWRRLLGRRAKLAVQGSAEPAAAEPPEFDGLPPGFVRKALRVCRRIVRRIGKRLRSFVVARIKRVLRALYWLSETDEFGTAADSVLRELAPDVIHAHDLSTLPLGGRVARALGARLVYDSHELEMHRNASYPSLVKWRRRRLESRYIRQADRVITVSESIADHLRDDYRITRPWVVMNAPMFDDEAMPARGDVRSDLGLAPETPLVVYVGSVTINRGIEQTVQALVHDPSLHFATVGPRRPATEAEVAALAERLGVRDRLHFVDPVRPNEVVGYIRTAGVSVLPIQNVCLSYYYCMPNKLLESVFAGVPVVVADLLEMRRFVEAHGGGMVMDETKPERIAQAIRHVLEQRERYVLSPVKRQEIAAKYGWPTQARRLCELYDGLGVPAASLLAAT